MLGHYKGNCFRGSFMISPTIVIGEVKCAVDENKDRMNVHVTMAPDV